MYEKYKESTEKFQQKLNWQIFIHSQETSNCNNLSIYFLRELESLRNNNDLYISIFAHQIFFRHPILRPTDILKPKVINMQWSLHIP